MKSRTRVPVGCSVPPGGSVRIASPSGIAVDDSSTRQKGGTGLGLAITKRIVEMHGGSITVESDLDRGSTFRIVVPVRAEEQREAA